NHQSRCAWVTTASSERVVSCSAAARSRTTVFLVQNRFSTKRLPIPINFTPAFRRARQKRSRATANIFSGRKVSLSSPLKILQLVHTVDPSVGGVATSVGALSRGIARRGHKIDIVVLDDPASAWIKDVGLTVHALGAGRGSYRYSSALMPWLREHGGDYDRVIVNGIW